MLHTTAFAAMLIPLVFGVAGALIGGGPGFLIGTYLGTPLAVAAGYAYDYRERLPNVLTKLQDALDEAFPLDGQPAGKWPTVRDPSDGRTIFGVKEPLREPPEGVLGLSLECAHCEEEIVVYYLSAGEHAQCGECGGRTAVPSAATETDKPSTLAKAYGYSDIDPMRGTLPLSAPQPNDSDRLPQPVDGSEQRAEEAKERLPKANASDHPVREA